MLEDLKAAKARDGPSRSTRSQTGSAGLKQSTDSSSSTREPITGRLKKKMSTAKDAPDLDTPSCKVTVSDGAVSLSTIGRCDDGSDDSLVSRKVAEAAVLQGIGRMKAIEPVTLSVALKAGETAQRFSFSRSWTPPRTVLHLSSGQLALVNVTYLVADGELTCEDLLIGLPVLQHLHVDTRTLLENNRAELDGSDCSNIGHRTMENRHGTVSRMMIARLNRTREVNSASSTENGEPSPERPRVNYYSARNEEDPLPDPSLIGLVDSDEQTDIEKALEVMKQSAADAGLPVDSQEELNQIVDDHKNIFRIGFSSGPPARFPPLKVDLTSDAKPVKVRLRNYSQEQREFLSGFVKKLIDHGMAYANPTSPWACAPLLVPKSGPSKFRFTVDLRPVNKYTVKHQYPMPNLEHELTKVATSRYYATFDFSHGYWQLELEQKSQVLQSFITPDGIYSPTRVLHGTTNAVTHLQSSLAAVLPPELRRQLLCWLDDALIHDATISGLLKSIRRFFALCVKYNLKLHPAKCQLFSKSIRWCGRLISPAGVRYDPAHLNGLLSMQLPTTGEHLQQFLCALQWVRNGIPKFSELVQPLHNFMESVYTRAGKRTKRAVARLRLSTLGWDHVHTKAFEACKNALSRQVTLSHRDFSKRLCVYTDASDTIWSAILTQVPFTDLKLPAMEQRHEPLAFLSGRFNKKQLGWSTLEKEAYAVLASLSRSHWITATPSGFDLYTDQNNLVFLFDPLYVVPDRSQTSLRKVLRWAVRLSVYNYTCFHIKGADNLWADLLGRWSAPVTVRRLVQIPELPSSASPEFEWPTVTTLVTAQQEFKDERPANLVLKDDAWRNPSGAIRIPDSASDIQLRLCIIAHTEPSGHRGRDTTIKVLRGSFFWSTLTADRPNLC